jgi:hypothetical protein
LPFRECFDTRNHARRKQTDGTGRYDRL